LAEPLVLERRPIVCFAGEATSEQYFSTTHGARSSGIREAERLQNNCKILQCMGKNTMLIV
jgi:hypothetical protein